MLFVLDKNKLAYITFCLIASLDGDETITKNNKLITTELNGII